MMTKTDPLSKDQARSDIPERAFSRKQRPETGSLSTYVSMEEDLSRVHRWLIHEYFRDIGFSIPFALCLYYNTSVMKNLNER